MHGTHAIRPLLDDAHVDQERAVADFARDVLSVRTFPQTDEDARTEARTLLAEMGLDIRYAKIQTLAHEVVDSFYVVGPDGPVIDEAHQREIDLALRHGLSLME